MRWASLLLTLPAICYSALPFWRGAWTSLRARALGMDVPVALGIAAAFGASVVATVSGKGDVWFDSVTMFIFLLLCSRYLNCAHAARPAPRWNACSTRCPHRPRCWNTIRPTAPSPSCTRPRWLWITSSIKPGEAVAADCIIIEGRTALDLSLLSGESAPVPKHTGDFIPGGAINASNMILARVVKRAQDSTCPTCSN
jgi:Cu2+-exporting ATPase